MSALTLPPALDLSGQRVLVTGAASGIGRATALVLASLGAHVVATDRASTDDVIQDIVRAGGQGNAIQGDLTDDTFLDQLFAGPRLHAMAHCAAILDAREWRGNPKWRERFAHVMDVNVRVPLEIGMRAVDHMAAHGGGHIALVGSVAGKTGGTSVNTPPDYSASKGAVHALVKWISRHGVGHNVMVNAVAPGPVETPMTRGSNLGPGLPLGRMGRPEELAWPIAFLCTPASSYLSGAVLDVNGGAFVG